ncbi:acetate kinase [Mucilaginibacter lappiensis]|uniref:Acetate kinase n=1 Tax=Mucilaginibacter lappiensis TaxID=354630 RepID=A0ABR6PV75_9SPHI|nr:acetate/propionate family kinase [Mucilaginibacter lappiensis]MBB6113039.1 acetate kinase [Mucilaginibacter lappiensis]SIS11064.1 acetate kinase [Mucilaginibacter lappiensis]
MQTAAEGHRSKKYILSINCGSSSLKFSLYHALSTNLEWAGSITRIGEAKAHLEIRDYSHYLLEHHDKHYKNFNSAVTEVIAWLKDKQEKYPLMAIGHRIVQGGPKHFEPVIITDELVKTLDEMVYLAPNHLPEEIATIKTFQAAWPDVRQVACFDTCFHHGMPSYVKDYPLPVTYKKMGLMKYGFHGLSYEFIMQELAKQFSPVAEQKIIIAHLGNGASMAAVKNGFGVETTMGLSPLGGLVMGTRSGDLDPGVILFLLKQAKLTPDELDGLLSTKSGLKAIAGISDIRELLQAEPEHPLAKEALTMFCYTATKYIGALAAAMGGLDMLVFTGGIGENSAIIRERICHELGFMGIELDKSKNKKNELIISKSTGKVSVRVIKTNEELMIARLVCSVFNYAIKQ